MLIVKVFILCIRLSCHGFMRKHIKFCRFSGDKNMIVNMGIEPKKITVLYNPMNIKLINEMANGQSPVVPNEYILYVGRFYAEKNLKFLINAFSIFLKKNPGYKLLLIGDGDERAKLIEQVRYLNISDSVIFINLLRIPLLI